jgi:hypothetical protein
MQGVASRSMNMSDYISHSSGCQPEDVQAGTFDFQAAVSPKSADSRGVSYHCSKRPSTKPLLCASPDAVNFLDGLLSYWRPKAPWAHGPTSPSPWAHGAIGPCAHGSIGPWAHGPRSPGPWAHRHRGPWAHWPMCPWTHRHMGPHENVHNVTTMLTWRMLSQCYHNVITILSQCYHNWL